MRFPEHLLTIDFETFWSADYTLKKISTEEYVRGPQFKAFGASVAYGDQPARWMPEPELRAFLARVPWAETAVLCQNAQFDGLILAHHYSVRPALWLCTLAMSRMALPRRRHSLAKLAEHFGLPAKGDGVSETKGLRELPPDVEYRLARYCEHDSDLTYAVFRKLLPRIPLDELLVIDITIRLFVEPRLRLNRQKARDLLAKVIRRKRSAVRRLGTSKAELSSVAKFAELLVSRFGLDIEYKVGKLGPLPALSKTDAYMKSLLAHDNPDIQAIAALRLDVKSTLEETRLRRLIDMNTRGPLPVFLNFAGAHTFRWSGGDRMNWQNFPRASELRRCIEAPPGHVIDVVDLSQIEARVLNTLAEQWDVLELFEHGDPYSVLASKFFGRPVNKKEHPKDRHVGKVGELGLGFGMGAPKLRGTLAVGALGGEPVFIDEETSKAWVGTYRGTHSRVVAYWAQAEVAIQLLHAKVENYRWGPMVLHRGYILLPNGTALDYTGLVREDGEWMMRGRDGKLILNTFGAPVRFYGGLVTENVVQALARVIISEAMVAMRKAGVLDRWPMVLTTHDEVGCVAPEAEGAECQATMTEFMTRRPSWLPRIPLAAEGGFDACYSK